MSETPVDVKDILEDDQSHSRQTMSESGNSTPVLQEENASNHVVIQNIPPQGTCIQLSPSDCAKPLNNAHTNSALDTLGLTKEMIRKGERISSDQLEAVRKDMVMQEKILAALQQDNESLLNEKRILVSRIKELEDALANLEAKHSLLLSAHETDVKRGESTTAATNTTINSLRASVSDLQRRLDGAESDKTMVLAQMELLSQEKGRLQETEVEIHRLRSELRQREYENQEAIGEIAKKVSVYVDNQEYNRAHEELIKEQEETIRALRVQVNDLSSAKNASNAGQSLKSKGMDKKDRQIHTLNKRIVELEDLLRRQHPDSIAELIRSCQPSAQDSQLFKKQEARVRQLEQALIEKDKCTEAAVQQLRVETEKIRFQYEERISHIQAQLSERVTDGQEAARSKQLEKELLILRRSIGNTLSDEGEKDKRPLLPVVMTEAADELFPLKLENASLKARNRELEAEIKEWKGNAAVSVQLQSQIDVLTQELLVYKRMCTESQAMLREAHERWDQRLAQARQEFVSQLQTIRQEHNNEINRLQRLHQSDLKAALEKKNEQSQADLVTKVIGITGKEERDAFLLTVLDRLSFIEKRFAQKERETAYELAEVKRVAEFELSVQRQKSELLVTQKNQQINEFRLQLDQLITSMAAIQATSL